MKKAINLSIEEGLIKKVKKIAIDNGKTVSEIFEEFIQTMS